MNFSKSPNWEEIRKNPVITNVAKKPEPPVKNVDGQWSIGGQALWEFGDGLLYNPKTLQFVKQDGSVAPGKFHAATIPSTPSDLPHKDQLIDPREFPAESTIAEMVTWLQAQFPSLAFQVQKRVPFPPPTPIVGTGSEGTAEQIGFVEIVAASPISDQVVAINPTRVWSARHMSGGDAEAFKALVPGFRAAGLLL